MNLRNLILLLVMCLGEIPAFAQTRPAVPNPRWQKDRWPCNWITCPESSPTSYGVYHFRKTFDIPTKPEQFAINISADNRYRLFVNGTPVCWGPARGDIFHWYYETVDIAPYLTAGKNTLAVTVWNFGDWIPGAQISLRTGLIVLGNDDAGQIVNSNESWKVIEDTSYQPSLANRHDVGCSDIVDGNVYPWGWETSVYDDSHWKNAANIRQGQPYGNSSEYLWCLYPRDIPLMEETPQRAPIIRRTSGIDANDNFLNDKGSLVIPANTQASILLDQQVLTTAYPELKISKGKNSSIKLSYSEAMFDKNGQKADRNEIDGRHQGSAMCDIFYPDGNNNRSFRPLWFRTYRYLQIDIATRESPLVIENFSAKYTGYPFKEIGKFESDDSNIKKIWEVGWRTARLCAHETYFDCPYYEQLQYIGDTRIQALISLYVSGDDRLMRRAIKLFNYSRSYEGITTSRYPNRYNQYIPTFSLYWINMVHDYYMHRDDKEFVKNFIPGVKSVLEWFADKVDPQTGILGATPHWNFVDWPVQWPWANDKPTGGVPPGGYDGGSAITSLQFVYAINDAVKLFKDFGEPELAKRYEKLGASIKENVKKHCWLNDRKVMSDDIKHTSVSQHANIMAILTNTIDKKGQKELFDKIISDTEMIQATFYYRFYLIRAMKQVEKSDLYVSLLQPWYDMIDIGLTTFAENPEPTRSDCHAWSASPNYDLLATVCGIEPDSPGFRTVRINPHPGPLNKISGIMPHPLGNIELSLEKKDGKLFGSIFLPNGLTGTYRYMNKKISLKSGKNIIK